MIQTETYELNGRELIKRYSDLGMMIERDGEQYPEAVDPIEFKDERVYVETDILIEADEEATVEDYQEALAEMGVTIND